MAASSRARRPKSEVRRAMRRSSVKRSSICCWKLWNLTTVRFGLMLARVSPTIFSNPSDGLGGLDDQSAGVHRLVFVEWVVGVVRHAGALRERQKVHGVVLPVDAGVGGVFHLSDPGE